MATKIKNFKNLLVKNYWADLKIVGTNNDEWS